jgi:hypothetical protein
MQLARALTDTDAKRVQDDGTSSLAFVAKMPARHIHRLAECTAALCARSFIQRSNIRNVLALRQRRLR